MPKNKHHQDSSVDQPSAFENAALGFVYKSLINRDPNKRKIKPVESILSMDADLGDSESDDSDYKPTNLDVEDVEIESDADNDKRDNGENKSSNGKVNSGGGGAKRKKQTTKSDQDPKSAQNNGSDADDSSSGSDDDEDDDSDDSSDSDTGGSDNDDDAVATSTFRSMKKSTEKLLNSKKQSSTLLSTNDNNNLSVGQQASTSKNEPVPLMTESELVSGYKKLLICAVCLGEVSHSEDEIVECDACGISVHEMCYGISSDDTESVHSDASSASTEPWFCDPCKAGVKNPLCELCPNQGGIYKITDNGRWVHMVCALYTQGITFADGEKFGGPILSEINYSRWGSKICMLCEDDRFSQTGVCICCDAGMCKTYFHVTCAQREGLLTELRHMEEGDPYIAYCRLHSNRQLAKKKRRNYHALLARYRYLMKNHPHSLKIEDSITNQRTLNKLYIQRNKFRCHFQTIENANIPTKRTPRLLDASPSAMRRLTNRCELAGFNWSRSSQLVQEELSDIRKKWHIPPAFSVEFISYYIDRNERIAQLQAQSQELLKQNKHLKEVEANVFAKYNQLLTKSEQTKSMNESIRAKIRHYLAILGRIAGPSSSTTTTDDDETALAKRLKLGQRIMNLPEVSDRDQPDGVSGGGQSSASQGPSSLKSPKTKTDEFRLKECATCKKSKEQHMMALCDSCHLYYHLHCLDPPLKRMPKKTRFGGWQCSNCTENEEQEDEDEGIDENKTESHNGNISSTNDDSAANSDINSAAAIPSSRRRRLRENPKTVTKYSEHEDCGGNINQAGTASAGGGANHHPKRGRPKSSSTNQATNSITNNSNFAVNTGNRRGRRKQQQQPPSSPANCNVNTSMTIGRKRKLSVSNDARETSEELIIENGNGGDSTSPTTTNKTFKRSATAECYVCNVEIQPKLSVRCDNCGNNYHFGCLEPPCTKTPKRRGYTWCCFVCEKKDDKRSDSHSNSSNTPNTSSSSVECLTIDESKEPKKEPLSKAATPLASNNNNVDCENVDSTKSKTQNVDFDCSKTDDQPMANHCEPADDSTTNTENRKPDEEPPTLSGTDHHQPQQQQQNDVHDDINTVLNDIIMLEEEQQNQKHDVVAETTTTTTATANMASDGNDCSGTKTSTDHIIGQNHLEATPAAVNQI